MTSCLDCRIADLSTVDFSYAGGVVVDFSAGEGDPEYTASSECG